MNAVYFIEVGITKVHHLLLLDGTSDMVNEENEKAEYTLVNVLLAVSRESARTSLLSDPCTRREGVRGSSP